MKKVVLVGASLNSGNKGVNALTRGEIALLFKKYGYDINIKILSYTISNRKINQFIYNDKEIAIEEIPCNKLNLVKSYLYSKLKIDNYIIKEIKSADIIFDISEGDSFSDIYGIKRFIQHSILKLISIKSKAKFVIMPQTLGPFKKSWVKRIAKNILKGADFVFVRDDLSKDIIRDELKLDKKITYIPDMAFYMDPDNSVSIKSFIKDESSIKVGINVSALLYNGGYNGNNMFNLKVDYKKLVYSLIYELNKIPNVEMILIPHVLGESFEIEDDFRVCKLIAEELKNNSIHITTLDRYYREDELKSIISGCDFFIGSRMHACIGAISTLVPTAPISYSRKFIGIWDKIGLGYCVTDPKRQNEVEIIENIIRLFNERQKIKEKLEKEIPMLKEKIEKIIDIIEET